PSAVRQAVRRLFAQGLAPADIARSLDLPASTVRLWLRRFRQHGDAALRPAYASCGRHQSLRPSPLLPLVLQLHAEPPRWGAGRLRVEWAALRPAPPLPTPRTLQRWLRRHHVAPARPGRPAKDPRSRQVHDVWQVDAVEQLPLATGQQVSWLRLADEASG